MRQTQLRSDLFCGRGQVCAGEQGAEGILSADLWRAVKLAERPGDVKCGVVPDDAALAGRVVDIGGLVEDFSGFGEDDEAVGEALWDPDHLKRIHRVEALEVDADVLAELGRVGAEIDGDIPDMAGEDAEEFALGLDRKSTRLNSSHSS